MEKINDLVSLQRQVKTTRSQDKPRKQNFQEDMKKVLEPITDTFKHTDQKTIGTVKDTARTVKVKKRRNN